MRKCHYHPECQLQNFCATPACSLPLCARCIQIHLHDRNTHHHLLPLNDMVSMTKQQLSICLTGLTQQKTTLDSEYRIECILNNYMEMINKHEKKTEQQLKQYYQHIKQQLHRKIQTLHQEHFGELAQVIGEKVEVLKKWMERLESESEKVIQGVIVLNSSDQVGQVEELFARIKGVKENFAEKLPELVPADNGKLNIVFPSQKNHRIEPQISKPGSKNQSRIKKITFKDGAGLERIIGLEQRLSKIRNYV